MISPTETVDVSMRTSMTEKDRETGKTSSKKRLSSGAHFDLSFTQSHYLNLATIEELDADTGEVKAIHSLVDQTIADTKVTKSIEGGAEPKEPQIDRVYALVLLPTRELALQASSSGHHFAVILLVIVLDRLIVHRIFPVFIVILSVYLLLLRSSICRKLFDFHRD